MPFLMTDMAAGSKAVTDMTTQRLEREYAPRTAEANITNLESTAQLNKLRVSAMGREAEADAEVRPKLAELYKDPSFQQLPASEQMKKFASIYSAKNPEKAADYINKSSQALDHEARAENLKAQAHDRHLNTARQLTLSLDVNDPSSLVKAKESAPKELAPLFEGAEKEWAAATTPEQRTALKDKWGNMFKTLAERGQEVKEQEVLRKAKADEQKATQQQRMFELALARITASVGNKERTEDRKDREATTKLISSYNARTRHAYDVYMKDHSRLLSAYNKAEAPAEKNRLAEEMSNRASAYEDDVSSMWRAQGADLGIPKPLVTSSKAEEKKVPEAKSGPKAGTVEGGYKFKGGDPSKKENWEKVN